MRQKYPIKPSWIIPFFCSIARKPPNSNYPSLWSTIKTSFLKSLLDLHIHTDRFLFYFLSNHIDFHYHLLPNYHLYTARSVYTHVWTQDTFSINHSVRVWKSAENIFFANDILAYGIASYISQYRSPYFTLYSFLFLSVRPSCCRTICFCFFVTSKESSCPCSSIYLDQTSKPVFYFWANPTLCFLATNPTLLFWMASPSRALPLRWYPSSLTTFSQYFPFVQRFGVGNRVDLKLRFSLFVPLIQKILSWWDVYVAMWVRACAATVT